MADLMWSTVKEPLDSALCFDKESLDLAFKYFMSPTLTMRLAGLSQITVSHRHFVLSGEFKCRRSAALFPLIIIIIICDCAMTPPVQSNV